jgi:hypothetical protein
MKAPKGPEVSVRADAEGSRPALTRRLEPEPLQTNTPKTLRQAVSRTGEVVDFLPPRSLPAGVSLREAHDLIATNQEVLSHLAEPCTNATILRRQTEILLSRLTEIHRRAQSRPEQNHRLRELRLTHKTKRDYPEMERKLETLKPEYRGFLLKLHNPSNQLKADDVTGFKARLIFKVDQFKAQHWLSLEQNERSRLERLAERLKPPGKSGVWVISGDFPGLGKSR